MSTTKTCENCDQKIGESEKVCPKCQLDFEATEERLKEDEVIDKIKEKRRKSALPPKEEPEPKPTRKSIFHSLNLTKEKE